MSPAMAGESDDGIFKGPFQPNPSGESLILWSWLGSMEEKLWQAGLCLCAVRERVFLEVWGLLLLGIFPLPFCPLFSSNTCFPTCIFFRFTSHPTRPCVLLVGAICPLRYTVLMPRAGSVISAVERKEDCAKQKTSNQPYSVAANSPANLIWTHCFPSVTKHSV